MRILHITQPDSGGTAVVVAALVKAGIASGHEVSVAAARESWLYERLAGSHHRWHDVGLTRRPGFGDFRAVRRIRRLAKHVDVIHAHSSKAGAVARLAVATMPHSARPRVIFTPHGWSWYVGGFQATIYRVVERLLAPIASAIVAVSEGEYVDGKQVLGSSARLVLIPNGIDVEHFAVCDRWARDPSERSGFLLVQVGRLCRQKGQDRSLRALAQLTNVDAHLRFVGSGPDERDLRQLATDLGVSDRVEFVGTDDPRPHLQSSDVVLLPSRWEGMSLAMLEALAMGGVVVCTRVSGAESCKDVAVIIENNADAHNALAAQVRDLLFDEKRRANLSLRAHDFAVQNHDFRSTAAQYERLWTANAVG